LFGDNHAKQKLMSSAFMPNMHLQLTDNHRMW